MRSRPAGRADPGPRSPGWSRLRRRARERPADGSSAEPEISRSSSVLGEMADLVVDRAVAIDQHEPAHRDTGGRRHRRDGAQWRSPRRAHARGIDLERGELPAHPLEGRAHGRPCTGGRRDQQVPASAGTADLAPGRASACGRIQHRLDRRVLRDIGGSSASSPRRPRAASPRAGPCHRPRSRRASRRPSRGAASCRAGSPRVRPRTARSDGRSARRCGAPSRCSRAGRALKLLGGIGPDVQRGDVGAVARELDQVAPLYAAA